MEQKTELVAAYCAHVGRVISNSCAGVVHWRVTKIGVGSILVLAQSSEVKSLLLTKIQILISTFIN